MSNRAELYACLYAREFPAQAMLRLRAELRDKPCVILEGDSPIQHVCSCNTTARLLGVEHRMTHVEMDTFPSVTVLPRSLAEEATAKTAVLECAGTFSPSVEDVSTGSELLCVIDIAGTEKLHGSQATLGRALFDRVKTLGISSTVAIASNFHTAICLARGVPPRNRLTVIPPGGESTTLALIPLSVLDLTEDQAQTFSQWGVHTLGMLAGLPAQAGRLRLPYRGHAPELLDQPRSAGPLYNVQRKLRGKTRIRCRRAVSPSEDGPDSCAGDSRDLWWAGG
jgi:protein ImuB